MAADRAVLSAALPLSMYLGPEEVLVTLDVVFKPDLSSGQVAEAVRRLESEIRERYGRINRIYIEPRVSAEAAPAPASRTQLS